MITKSQETAHKLLSDLAAFNKLDRSIVYIIGEAFELDAFKLCREQGITYWINKPVTTTNEQPFTKEELKALKQYVGTTSPDFIGDGFTYEEATELFNKLKGLIA